MTQREEFSQVLERICGLDPRYHPEAYTFLLTGLHYTVEKLKRQGHVSGRELTEGLREYALQQYGRMAGTVLAHWGISCTDDFGHIVFNLVEQGLLGKTEQDRLDDFKNGFEFKKAFENSYSQEA